LPSNSVPWRIGASSWGGSSEEAFNGVIDEVQVYNRALSESEVRALYDAGSAGVCNCIGVTCTALDQCHSVGTCSATTGECSNPPQPDGTSCSDGNACTQTDTCQSGACTGSRPVVCMASDQCHVAGTCDPATGQCSNPAAANGTACNDG